MRPHLRPLSWLLLALALGPICAVAQPAGPPRVSPLSTVSQVVGVSRLAIVYSRPAVRERTVWGELVPWGEVWRTGANEATTIEFSDDVQVNGESLAAGTYALFTIPGPEEWTVIFNRDAEQWGAFSYDPASDALRVAARPREAPFQESFLIQIPTVGADSATVTMHWGNTLVPFEVSFDIRQAAVRRAREFVAKASPADGRMVWNWANYFYQNEFNSEEALRWSADLAQAAPMYWTYALEARLRARNGQPEEAMRVARQALERAAGDESQQPGVETDAAALATELEEWTAAAAAEPQ